MREPSDSTIVWLDMERGECYHDGRCLAVEIMPQVYSPLSYGRTKLLTNHRGTSYKPHCCVGFWGHLAQTDFSDGQAELARIRRWMTYRREKGAR